MSKKIAVLITDDFEDSEFTSPAEAFKLAGHQVITIEKQAGKTVKGKQGEAEVAIDRAIDDVTPGEFDALLLPGGYSPDPQTACWSYLIRYAIEEIPGMTAGFAANYLTATMVCFFIGRFTGTWLIRRFAPHNVLAIYAFIAMLLCLLSAFSGGHVGLLALTLCSAFMSIQYPTIFSLGIKHLGQDTKYGSSFIVMTIIGGGIVTPVMGFVSDAAGNIPTAELVPALCFAIIFIFARFRSQAATN